MLACTHSTRFSFVMRYVTGRDVTIRRNYFAQGGRIRAQENPGCQVAADLAISQGSGQASGQFSRDLGQSAGQHGRYLGGRRGGRAETPQLVVSDSVIWLSVSCSLPLPAQAGSGSASVISLSVVRSSGCQQAGWGPVGSWPVDGPWPRGGRATPGRPHHIDAGHGWSLDVEADGRSATVRAPARPSPSPRSGTGTARIALI